MGLGILFALNLSHMSKLYSVPLRALLLILAVYLIRMNIEKFRNRRYSWFIFSIFVFWIFYFAKVLLTENLIVQGEIARPWFDYIFYGLTYVLVPYVSFCVVDFQKYKDYILNGFIFSGFALGLVALYAYGGVLGSGVTRISLLVYETGQDTLNPLALSYSGSMTMVLCIHKMLHYKMKRFEYIYLIATFILGFILFLLGASRGSIVAIALCVFAFLYFSSAKRKAGIALGLVILFPIVLWAIEASGSGIIDRLQNTSEDGGGGRDTIWAQNFAHFTDNILFGGKIEIGGIYPHNFIIEILMATGLVGALLFFPVFFMAIKRSLKINRKDSFIVLIFIQGFSLHMFSGSIIAAFLLFIPMAIILAYNKETVVVEDNNSQVIPL